jgi:hypothetical protein
MGTTPDPNTKTRELDSSFGMNAVVFLPNSDYKPPDYSLLIDNSK